MLNTKSLFFRDQYHHNETRRPNFPMRDVAPDMIFKYPRIPDPPLIPCKANSPCSPGLQPIVVVPPPAPAPPPTSKAGFLEFLYRLNRQYFSSNHCDSINSAMIRCSRFYLKKMCYLSLVHYYYIESQPAKLLKQQCGGVYFCVYGTEFFNADSTKTPS